MVWSGNGTCCVSVPSGENINICWSPDGQTIAVGNKDDVVTFIDAKTHRSKAEEQFKFEVNEISWNNDNNMFFLTNGNGCINILRQVPVAAGWLGWLQSFASAFAAFGKLESHIPAIPCPLVGMSFPGAEVATVLGWAQLPEMAPDAFPHSLDTQCLVPRLGLLPVLVCLMPALL